MWGEGWEELPLHQSPPGPGVGGGREGGLGTTYHDLGLCFLLFLSSGQPEGTKKSLQAPSLCLAPTRPLWSWMNV